MKRKKFGHGTTTNSEEHITHTIKRRKNCNHSDNCISYRTYRMRSLLAYYLKYVSYNVPWMWKYNNTKTPFDTLQRRNIMGSSCRYCGNPIVFDYNILSKNGKHKPLNKWNHEPHDCKFSPFNINKSRSICIRKEGTRKD